jgi:hypothetical protein
MQKSWTFMAALILTSAVAVYPALAGGVVVVGVNTVDAQNMSETQQDALIELLKKNGVNTVRSGIGDKFTHFLVQAYRRGIGAVVIANPTEGSPAEPRPADPAKGITWRQIGLSGANPTEFRKWLSAQLAALDAAGVRLTAIEIGNEINSTGFNGDFPLHSSGRVLGLADLQNPGDTDGAAISAGYRAYIRVLEQAKQARDGSKINNRTPILSAGLANVGPPRSSAAITQIAVAIPATLQYWRAYGLDKYADGYGIHVYSSGDPHQTLAMRTKTLEDVPFSECHAGAKPCWLTEWGFTNPDHSCPLNDNVRAGIIGVQRTAFKHFIDQRRLSAILYYSWAGHLGVSESNEAIFRCGALTEAGKLALNPM